MTRRLVGKPPAYNWNCSVRFCQRSTITCVHKFRFETTALPRERHVWASAYRERTSQKRYLAVISVDGEGGKRVSPLKGFLSRRGSLRPIHPNQVTIAADRSCSAAITKVAIIRKSNFTPALINGSGRRESGWKRRKKKKERRRKRKRAHAPVGEHRRFRVASDIALYSANPP